MERQKKNLKRKQTNLKIESNVKEVLDDVGKLEHEEESVKSFFNTF